MAGDYNKSMHYRFSRGRQPRGRVISWDDVPEEATGFSNRLNVGNEGERGVKGFGLSQQGAERGSFPTFKILLLLFHKFTSHLSVAKVAYNQQKVTNQHTKINTCIKKPTVLIIKNPPEMLFFKTSLKATKVRARQTSWGEGGGFQSRGPTMEKALPWSQPNMPSIQFELGEGPPSFQC